MVFNEEGAEAVDHVVFFNKKISLKFRNWFFGYIFFFFLYWMQKKGNNRVIFEGRFD